MSRSRESQTTLSTPLRDEPANRDTDDLCTSPLLARAVRSDSRHQPSPWKSTSARVYPAFMSSGSQNRPHGTFLVGFGRVRTARARQFDRQGCLNRDLSRDQAVALCQMTSQTREWLVNALERLSVSPRSAHRRLRVARTVADIEGVRCVTKGHLAHALALRETPPDGGAVKSF